MKRLFAMFVVVALLGALIIPSYALDQGDSGSKYSDLSNEELMNYRSTFYNDMEGNAAAIAEIDNELLARGLVEISEAELIDKINNSGGQISATEPFGDVMPMVDVSSTSTTWWVSERSTVNWYGNTYEVQIITGMPKNGDSELVKENMGYSVQSPDNINANLWDIIKVGIVDVGLALVEDSTAGAVLSTGISLVEYLKDVGAAVSTVNSVELSDITYIMSVDSHERCVFIKSQGALDEDQKLIYSGNSLRVSVVTTIASGLTVNGVYYSQLEAQTYYQTFQSEFYETDELRYHAAELFWNYRQGRVSLDMVYPPVRMNIDSLNLWTLTNREDQNEQPYSVSMPRAKFVVPEDAFDYD